jgi:hypothetical protein
MCQTINTNNYNDLQTPCGTDRSYIYGRSLNDLNLNFEANFVALSPSLSSHSRRYLRGNSPWYLLDSVCVGHRSGLDVWRKVNCIPWGKEALELTG